MDKLAYQAYQNNREFRDTVGAIKILGNQFKEDRVHKQFKAYGYISRKEIMDNITKQMQDILNDENPDMDRYYRYENMLKKFNKFGEPYYRQIKQHAYKPIGFKCLDAVVYDLDHDQND